MVIVVLTLVLLSALVQSYPVVLWPCTALLGLGYGTIIPCSYVWVVKFLEFDGVFSAVYWTGYSIGYTVLPALMGFLFNKDPMWFPYLQLACGVGMSAMYVNLRVVVKCCPVVDDVVVSALPSRDVTAASDDRRTQIARTVDVDDKITACTNDAFETDEFDSRL